MNLPFEGDTYIGLELIKLRDKFKLINCVETGTQYGNSTKELSNIFENVYTVEADKNYFIEATENLHEVFNVYLHLGKSVMYLKHNKIDNVLFYLDAHGCDIGGCELKEELEIIANHKLNNVCIAIHDFKVPDHPEFGYDTYDYELCFEEIEQYLKNIYPDGFNYHYNEKADGAMRGIIFIYPLVT